MDYANRVALVTGASSGIGRQLAVDFARRGAKLVLAARREALLREVEKECGEVEIAVGDIADRAFADSLVERSLSRFGRLDVLVNNAGIPMHKQIYDVTPEDLEYTLAVNFLAAARLALAAIPPMLRQGEGWIVNISSMAGLVPPPRETVYAASKYAMTGFSEGLALDLAGSNVHSAVIHVGPIDTEIWDKAGTEGAPIRFRGRKYPPSAVSEAVFACIEKRRHEATVPRVMRLAQVFKLVLPGLFRRGAARYDPVPPAALTRARGANRNQGGRS